MADKNMISYLYYKKLEDELFKFEDSTLSELEDNITKSNNKLFRFINKRVHPRSKNKLKYLVNDYINNIFARIQKENEMYYVTGFEDGIRFVIDIFSVK